MSLMRASEEEFDRALRQIKALENSKLAAQCSLLSGLRYDKSNLALLERVRNMLWTEEILKESAFYQMILEEGMEKGLEKGIERGIEKGIEQGLEKGLEKGIAAGRIEEARRNARLVAAIRFPSLGQLPELGSISDPERLEALIERLLLAEGEEAARAAILQVTQPECHSHEGGRRLSFREESDFASAGSTS